MLSSTDTCTYRLFRKAKRRSNPSNSYRGRKKNDRHHNATSSSTTNVGSPPDCAGLDHPSSLPSEPTIPNPKLPYEDPHTANVSGHLSEEARYADFAQQMQASNVRQRTSSVDLPLRAHHHEYGHQILAVSNPQADTFNLLVSAGPNGGHQHLPVQLANHASNAYGTGQINNVQHDPSRELFRTHQSAFGGSDYHTGRSQTHHLSPGSTYLGPERRTEISQTAGMRNSTSTFGNPLSAGHNSGLEGYSSTEARYDPFIQQASSGYGTADSQNSLGQHFTVSNPQPGFMNNPVEADPNANRQYQPFASHASNAGTYGQATHRQHEQLYAQQSVSGYTDTRWNERRQVPTRPHEHYSNQMSQYPSARFTNPHGGAPVWWAQRSLPWFILVWKQHSLPVHSYLMRYRPGHSLHKSPEKPLRFWQHSTLLHPALTCV
ncbi:hypothetical protein SCHPADRAFT_660768 [Schizopora paradoxa]|uniref:Uncharacterized protein n=1 Tax=Schizopora paradoxa TaxID=27342 RepID=A0A0H2R731_9AGAM|nr:hypothetical protein SCHPADRAFT_660768 [Schizopora paradoxa]